MGKLLKKGSMNQLTLEQLNITPSAAFAIISANVEKLQEDGFLDCAVFLAQRFGQYMNEQYKAQEATQTVTPQYETATNAGSA